MGSDDHGGDGCHIDVGLEVEPGDDAVDGLNSHRITCVPSCFTEVNDQVSNRIGDDEEKSLP